MEDLARNLFADVPHRLPRELTETLVAGDNVRIERIVSTGQSSPDGCWYDQDQDEWVIVLKGEAKLLIDGAEHPIQLGAGDYLNIPAHRKHQVAWTTPDEPTVWLAVFYGKDVT